MPHSSSAPVFSARDVTESGESGYPEPWRTEAAKRHNRRLGQVAGLTGFGVVMTRLEPGGRSSQRHAHSHEDEFIYVLEGTVVLATSAGEQILTTGMCAGFPAGTGDAHCFFNRTATDAVLLVVGDRHLDDRVTYPDIDLVASKDPSGKHFFTHRDGTRYPEG